MANDTATPDPVRSIMLAIAEKTEFAGGAVPRDEAAFWRELCISMDVPPKDDVVANARAVVEALGEDWDGDYQDERDGVTISAYEAVAASLHMDKQAETVIVGPTEAEELEDEDDAIGPLGAEFHGQATKSDPPIATLMGWIRDGTLVLDPDWQRSFVWKHAKQRRLIESIFLGLPIPSFLLYENSKTGKRYVIDGRQRLETIDRFCSLRVKGEKPRRFRTFNAKTEGWRPGEALSEAAGKYYENLPQGFKTRIDGHPLVVFTFRDIQSDKLYQIFKRYNTGAVALNAAEIRNAVYQDAPLHRMMYRLAGEHGDPAKYKDKSEREVGDRLRNLMGNKTQRYGAYDLIGRYFAFRYGRTGSVANATNTFMEAYREREAMVEGLRQEFIEAFNKALQWYEYPLIEPEPDGSGRFHAFLATLQLVSTARMLEHIKAGRASEEAVRGAIMDLWVRFTVGNPDQPGTGKLEMKQNSTLFWTSQGEWTRKLEEACGVGTPERPASVS